MNKLFLLFLLGCGAGSLTPGYLPKSFAGEAGAETVDLHRIYGSGQYMTWHQWNQSPYFRVYDQSFEYPVFVLIDELGMGCVVPADIYHLQPPELACPNGWRHPRPENGKR